MMAKIYRFIFSILLVCLAAIGKAQTIDGKLYTPFNNYYQWIGGKFNSNLNIPKIAATTGRDTGGIRYNLTDSSMYVWTGSQWRQVGGGAIPTLQQVTTAGNSTTDSINIIDASSNRLSSLVRTQVGGPTDLSGRLILRSNFNSNYALYNPTGITYLTATNTTSIAFPDTGITSRFVTRVAIDGNTYAPSTGGLINLGNTDTATVVKAYVTNAEAVTITKGQVVYIFGASGDRAAVKLAKNTSDTFSSKTLGIVRADIAAGQAGWVTTQGQVSGINLGAYSPGDILWLDSVPGGFTKTKPVAPLHGVFVGVVERANAGNGLIYVKPQNGVELDEIHNVLITSPTNNQVLSYTASTGIWENKSVTTALGYMPVKINIRDTIASQKWWVKDSLPITTARRWALVVDTSTNRIERQNLNIFRRDQDTVPLAVFNVGSAAAGDTAAFSTSTLAGSFYLDGTDTMFVTSYRVALQGTSASITPEVWFNDSLNVTTGGTRLATGSAITNLTTGTSVTPNTNKIPPGNFVFVRFSAVTTKPTYFTLTLFGYRIRKQ